MRKAFKKNLPSWQSSLMKRLLIPFAIVSVLMLFSITSCKESLNDLTFSRQYASGEFVVDTTSEVGVFSLGEFEVNPDIINEMGTQGFSLNNLKQVTIKRITVKNANAAQNLNYFRSLQIRMSGPEGSAEVVFANYTLPKETTQQSVDLTPESVELRDVFKSTSVRFSLYGETDLPIQPQPVPLQAELEFEFRAALGN